MSKLKLPIGISDYKKLREAGFYLVDKTLFIEDVITNSSEVLLFTRPRRFGKTINLSMLYYFLTDNSAEINSEIFQDTNISKNKEICEAYQNQHPSIFISFKSIKKLDFESAKKAVINLVKDLYESFSDYLLDSLSEFQKKQFNDIRAGTADISIYEKSLFYLSEYLHKKTGKKAYILVDEYDTPITAAYINEYYDDMVNLMRGLLGETFKDNRNLAKGVVTGITKVSQESIFSGFNNPDVYNMLRDDYGQYFGFTEDEVINLLKIDDHIDELEKIKDWYNGYQVGKHTLYNPWSILNCINQHYKYEAYWLNTSDNALIKEQLSHGRDNIKEIFIKLIQGEHVEQPIADNLIFPDLKDSEEAIWSLLHASGYLNVHSTRFEDFGKVAEISIPNREVKFVYDSIITNFFRKTLKLETYKQFTRYLAAGDVETFKAILSAYIIQSGSFFDFNKNPSEQIFHIFMLGLVVGLRDDYMITSNLESGFGRYDLALIPKDETKQGILLEFKVANSEKDLTDKSLEALNQIKSKKYITTFLQNNIKSVLALGFAFYKKQVEVASEVINL